MGFFSRRPAGAKGNTSDDERSDGTVRTYRGPPIRTPWLASSIRDDDPTYLIYSAIFGCCCIFPWCFGVVMWWRAGDKRHPRIRAAGVVNILSCTTFFTLGIIILSLFLTGNLIDNTRRFQAVVDTCARYDTPCECAENSLKDKCEWCSLPDGCSPERCRSAKSLVVDTTMATDATTAERRTRVSCGECVDDTSAGYKAMQCQEINPEKTTSRKCFTDGGGSGCACADLVDVGCGWSEESNVCFFAARPANLYPGTPCAVCPHQPRCQNCVELCGSTSCALSNALDNAGCVFPTTINGRREDRCVLSDNTTGTIPKFPAVQVVNQACVIKIPGQVDTTYGTCLPSCNIYEYLDFAVDIVYLHQSKEALYRDIDDGDTHLIYVRQAIAKWLGIDQLSPAPQVTALRRRPDFSSSSPSLSLALRFRLDFCENLQNSTEVDNCRTRLSTDTTLPQPSQPDMPALRLHKGKPPIVARPLDYSFSDIELKFRNDKANFTTVFPYRIQSLTLRNCFFLSARCGETYGTTDSIPRTYVKDIYKVFRDPLWIPLMIAIVLTASALCFFTWRKGRLFERLTSRFQFKREEESDLDALWASRGKKVTLDEQTRRLVDTAHIEHDGTGILARKED